MKQQVFVIHGGNAFDTYEEYIEFLKRKEINLEQLQYKDWKHTLPDALGEKYEVIAPRMPNGNNAKYLEWKIYFEKFIPYLNDNLILIGHSLGGIFLAKFLSEAKFPKTILGLFLVAAPYNTAAQHPLADFILSGDIKQLEHASTKIFLYHSKDDEVVPFSNFEKYKEMLPQSIPRILEDRGHINQLEFPELLADVRSLQIS